MVQDQGAVEEQHILIGEGDIVVNQGAAHITDVYQGDLAVGSGQQGGQTAAKGVPEQNQFLVGRSRGVVNLLNGGRASQIQVIGIGALGFFQVVQGNRFAGGQIRHPAALQRLVAQIDQRVRGQGKGGLSCVGSQQGPGGTLLQVIFGNRRPHLFTQQFGHGRKALLPPVGVRFVVAFLGQGIGNVKKPHGKSCFQQLLHAVIIHGGIAQFRGKEIVFVRYDGKIGVHLGAVQAGVLNVPDALDHIGDGDLPQGIVQLFGSSAGKIDAVVVQLANAVVEIEGFQCAQVLPQGELIHGGVFHGVHETAVQNIGLGCIGPLGQIPPLRQGDGIPAQKHGDSAAQKQGKQQHEGEDLSFHMAS